MGQCASIYCGVFPLDQLIVFIRDNPSLAGFGIKSFTFTRFTGMPVTSLPINAAPATWFYSGGAVRTSVTSSPRRFTEPAHALDFPPTLCLRVSKCSFFPTHRIAFGAARFLRATCARYNAQIGRVAVTAVVLAWLGAASAWAANTLTVNTLNDSNDATNNCDSSGSGSVCSLRDAIDQANNDNNGDTITFSVSGTITLGSGLPAIYGASTTISNAATAGSITISGNGQFQPLQIGAELYSDIFALRSTSPASP